ncbi:hypothetical protein E4U13_007956, partial [Claviceps humidiphila]
MDTVEQSDVKMQEHIRSGEATHQRLTKNVDDLTNRNFTSPTFKFVVGRGGETEKVFYLHKELVASQSCSLELSMIVASVFHDYVDIDCHDVRTVNAFTAYLYTGDYDIAPELSSLGSDARQHVCWRPQNPHWEMLLQSKEYGFQIPLCTVCNNEAPLSDRGTCNICRCRGSARQMLVSPAPVLNPGSLDTNFTEVFILHAKVFLFAVHYKVAELRELSLRKLHQALCGFRLSKERVGDIMSLVRFCFDQDRDDDSRLKKLVASYSAAIIDERVPAEALEDFRKLSQEYVEFGAN